ncbi:MAG: hypothetical protein IAI50_19715 [Candidatus Eremiobacteraeota bacterium]|nr:hypothetical protein [Candidatus Eremiobacteraeota bacterium]
MKPLQHGAAAICSSLALFLLAATTAMAQTAPTASPMPNPADTSAPNSPGTGTGPAPRSAVPVPIVHQGANYVPTIDIIGQSTFATGGDYTSPGVSGITKVGGKITETIFGNLNFSYQHGYIDETIGSHPYPTAGSFNVNDPTDDWQLNYAVNKSVSASLGYFYRHRTCCPAANDPTNIQPITVHQAFLEVDYALPAIAALNDATLSLNARYTKALAHHPTPESVLLANPQISGDEGDAGHPTGGGTLTVPIDKKNGFSVFGNYTYAYDYFDYQPIAFWYNIVDYGFTRVVNPYLSFTLDSSNLTQHKNQDYPFLAPNTIHRTKFVLSADVRLGNVPH